ncbi:MAG: LLM class F420-dependent oxidoreductase [Chloroflexi bacterium AL-W]|nr:LLM class F420-dependent oxidoreductase [Chloroflexi bacterium AL-N1]NOK66359.1 LLM class F420-dependent oxidoreductase [Chloroflexi bacterium AL-N10]NOK71747.1 LLM class F420-dependent oxidoreductase [Chloroflexi bacterium AL-N5]NOK81004.1 LLM class F420-dependent oxidoreductase [Chloroflexi bacterium AL-W]NOK89277.1 LLM class F420-dependent oxidoreductase [Chloroflexi bacterium AL-N15]
MRIGAIFPQTEIGNDPIAIRDYAQAVESMGYTHVLVYDHVVGAGTATRPDWNGPYTSDHAFHEPFVLFGYLAGLTKHIELVTGVLILPQRQTTLVAKQAAQVDLLSGGRLRLGVGVGWNPVEFDALNENFHDRGARSEEQITVMRALWTEPVIDFRGTWHHIDAAGINPLPVQRPIPVWIGGSVDATLERVARVGDGWFPQGPPDDPARRMVEQLYSYTEAAGRATGSVGIEARLNVKSVAPAGWENYTRDWRQLGATHLTINTMGMNFVSPQDHIDMLWKIREVLGITR